jgi:hypothetical protein
VDTAGEVVGKNDLLTGLIVASANKPHLFGDVMEKVKVNKVVRDNLIEALPRMQLMAEMQGIRKRLEAHVERHNWPREVLPLIEYIEDDRVIELEDRLIEAATNNDWDLLIEEAREYEAAPIFRR